jgi:hypothetical protein
MTMRTIAVLSGLLLLAACSKTDAPASAAGEEAIACALGGATTFANVCAVDRARQNDGALVLIVRHPGGAFRRFEVLKDGRGLAVADGAQEAQNTLSGTVLEVVVGDDRYRFPVHARTGGKTDGPSDAATR